MLERQPFLGGAPTADFLETRSELSVLEVVQVRSEEESSGQRVVHRVPVNAGVVRAQRLQQTRFSGNAAVVFEVVVDERDLVKLSIGLRREYFFREGGGLPNEGCPELLHFNVSGFCPVAAPLKCRRQEHPRVVAWQNYELVHLKFNGGSSLQP